MARTKSPTVRITPETVWRKFFEAAAGECPEMLEGLRKLVPASVPKGVPLRDIVYARAMKGKLDGWATTWNLPCDKIWVYRIAADVLDALRRPKGDPDVDGLEDVGGVDMEDPSPGAITIHVAPPDLSRYPSYDGYNKQVIEPAHKSVDRELRITWEQNSTMAFGAASAPLRAREDEELRFRALVRYVCLKESVEDISKRYLRDPTTIWRWIRELAELFDIKLRSRGRPPGKK